SLEERGMVSIRILFSASEVVQNRGRMANLNQAIHGGLGGRGQPTDWSLVWVEVRAPAEVTHAGRGSLILEARLQASNHFRFEAPSGNGRFFSQPTIEFFRQAKADHPTPRAFHQRKASDNYSNRQANDEADNDGKGDGHGDTPPIRNGTIMVMATVLSAATDHLTTWAQSW